jgi:hypothetical protein
MRCGAENFSHQTLGVSSQITQIFMKLGVLHEKGSLNERADLTSGPDHRTSDQLYHWISGISQQERIVLPNVAHLNEQHENKTR